MPKTLIPRLPPPPLTVPAVEGVSVLTVRPVAVPLVSTGEVVSTPVHSLSAASMIAAPAQLTVGAVSPAPQFGLYHISARLSDCPAAFMLTQPEGPLIENATLVLLVAQQTSRFP